jgi:hypothetical protein
MTSNNDVLREREASRPMALWKSVAVYGSAWFWLFFGIWAMLQCFRADCAFVGIALTSRLPYTLAAWVLGAVFFGVLMWLFQQLMFRSTSRK